LFTESNIKVHSEQRRVFTSIYSMSALVSFEHFVDQCADLFEQNLSKKAQTGVSFDFSHWLQCYAFDVIGQITFGKRFGFLDNGDDIGGLIDALDTSFLPICILGLFQNLNYYVFQLRDLLTRYGSEKRTGFQFLNHFTQTTIDEYSKANKVAPITAEDENATEPILWKSFRKHEADPDHFTLFHIFSACAMNIGAGSDTTGITLTATFYYLITNPHAMKELRAEMDEKHRQGLLSERATFEEAQDMPYLQAVIKEALRMHPAVGLPLERIVPEGGAAIAGQFFPAGVSGLFPTLTLG
jgi:cytochrome P450